MRSGALSASRMIIIIARRKRPRALSKHSACRPGVMVFLRSKSRKNWTGGGEAFVHSAYPSPFFLPLAFFFLPFLWPFHARTTINLRNESPSKERSEEEMPCRVSLIRLAYTNRYTLLYACNRSSNLTSEWETGDNSRRGCRSSA